jgi:autotransporter-associated beta strand protein
MTLWNLLRRSRDRQFRLAGGCPIRRSSLSHQPVLEILEGRLCPTQHTWTGAVSTSWSNPLNWQEGVTPFGDNNAFLIYSNLGNSVKNFTSTDDLAPAGGTTIQDITFQSGGFTVNATPGNSINVAVNITDASTDRQGNVINADINLVGVGFNSTGASFIVNNQGETLFLGGVIGGPGASAFLSGAGTVEYTGTAANTYTGTTFVQVGTLLLNKPAGTNAFGGVLSVGQQIGTSSGPNIPPLVQLLADNQLPANADVQLGGGEVDLNNHSDTINDVALSSSNQGFIAVNTGTGTLTLTGRVEYINSAGGEHNAQISGNLELSNATHSFSISPLLSLAISGTITGSGGVEVDSGGALQLSGNSANTYTGTTFVLEGSLELHKPSGMNALAGPLVVGIDAPPTGRAGTLNATVFFNADNQIPATSPVSLNGSGFIATMSNSESFGPLTFTGGTLGDLSGTITLTSDVTANASESGLKASILGAVSLGGATRTFNVAASTGGTDLAIDGAITDGGASAGLIKTGAGTMELLGTSANTYSGPTSVQHGTLLLNKSAGVNALAGPLMIGSGSGAQAVRLGAGNQIPAATSVSVASSGLLDLNGNNNTLNALVLAGGSVATGAGLLTLGGDLITNAAPSPATVSGNLSLGGVARTFTIASGGTGSDLIVSAVVSDGGAAAALTKAGPGTLVLAGNNSYTGATTISAGKLLVDGLQPGSSVSVAAGSILGGTGTIGSLTVLVGGTVSPGSSPGILTVNGTATFTAGSTLNIELDGTTAGSEYDRLDVTGAVKLGGSTLVVNLGFASQGGDAFTILHSPAPLSGAFAGLPEQAKFVVGLTGFQISYLGGAGNDVVLTNTAATNGGGSGGGSGSGNGSGGSGSGSGTGSGNAVTGSDFTVDPGPDQAATVGTPVHLHGTVTDADPLDTHTFTWNVSSSNGQVVPSANQQDFNFTPTNQGTYTLTFTVVDNEGNVLGAKVIVHVDFANTNQRFVNQVYVDLLLRHVDSDGLTYWTGQLDRDVPRFQVVLNIEGSTEYRTNKVQSLYQRYLHRGADSDGLNNWLQALASGGTFEQVAAGIVGSTEYYQLHGATPDSFLDGLYHDVYNRTVDPSGRAAFDQALTTQSTGQAAAAVFAGTEFRQGLVRDAYQLLLARTVDSSGLQTFTNLLQNGAADELAQALIAGSDEFFARLAGG